ncbi:MAG: hypothetical protein V3V95_05130 [Thermodesulfobacteriota bacterium]
MPEDPNSYDRLSEMVIKLKDPKPLVWFMDSYEYVDLDDFLENVKSVYASKMEDKLYIHDEVEGFSNKDGPEPQTVPSIEIKEFKSGETSVQVSADRPGFVVFSEVWAPSWTVRVDGVKSDLVRAYGMLQAVRVEPGTHEITFEYRAFQSWKMRAAFTLSTLAFLFTIVIVGRRLSRGLDVGD